MASTASGREWKQSVGGCSIALIAELGGAAVRQATRTCLSLQQTATIEIPYRHNTNMDSVSKQFKRSTQRFKERRRKREEEYRSDSRGGGEYNPEGSEASRIRQRYSGGCLNECVKSNGTGNVYTYGSLAGPRCSMMGLGVGVDWGPRSVPGRIYRL